MPELIENLFSMDEANATLNALRPDGNEIKYGQYYALTNDQSLVRLPRLMAFQASINPAGDFPWYRCTMSSVPQNKINHVPWTPTVQKIKDLIEQRTGETWNLAHIIYYKDGDDSMGMHSDTMLDLAPGSTIAVVSFGATRELDLLKKGESTSNGPEKIKFDLPSNSLFLLDEETNQHYVHGIKKKRKNEVEDRIAIVFRNVTTFKTDHGEFYGHGSSFSTKQDIIQEEKQRKIVRYILSFLLTTFIIWVYPIFSTNFLKLLIGGIFWIFLNVIIKQIEQTIKNFTNKTKNERLQKLCKMKNFKTWNQTDMRDFLKYT